MRSGSHPIVTTAPAIWLYAANMRALPHIQPLILALLGSAIGPPALAGEWAMRAGDVLFTQPELTARVSGQTLTFYDNGRSIFAADGSYQWVYAGGGIWQGSWVAGLDSTICITYVTNVTRCDLYVKNKGRLVLISEEGDRFPVQSTNPSGR